MSCIHLSTQDARLSVLRLQHHLKPSILDMSGTLPVCFCLWLY